MGRGAEGVPRAQSVDSQPGCCVGGEGGRSSVGGDGRCRAWRTRAARAVDWAAEMDRGGMVDCRLPLCLVGIGGVVGPWDYIGGVWYCRFFWTATGGAGRGGRGRRARSIGRWKWTEGVWWTAVCHFVWLESVVWLGRGSILEVSFLWLLLLFSFFLTPSRLVSDLLLLSSPLTLRCAGGDDPTFGKTGQGFVFVVSDAHCVSSVFPHSIVYGAEHTTCSTRRVLGTAAHVGLACLTPGP